MAQARCNLDLSLQQIPYHSHDPSYQFVKSNDVLTRINVAPYRPASQIYHTSNPIHPPILPTALQDEVTRTITLAWYFNPLALSLPPPDGTVLAASGQLGHGLRQEAMAFINDISLPRRLAKIAQQQAANDLGKNELKWQKYEDLHSSSLALMDDLTALDAELDEFYGPDSPLLPLSGSSTGGNPDNDTPGATPSALLPPLPSTPPQSPKRSAPPTTPPFAPRFPPRTPPGELSSPFRHAVLPARSPGSPSPMPREGGGKRRRVGMGVRGVARSLRFGVGGGGDEGEGEGGFRVEGERVG